MKLIELIKEYPDVTLSMKGWELKEFGEGIADHTAKKVLKDRTPKKQTRLEYIAEKKICAATFWRWQRDGIIKTEKKGNKVYVLPED